MRWDPGSYARDAGFVAQLGEPLLELLAARAGDRILDIGCGDGALTEKLVAAGCEVVGIDSSPDQVRAARARGIDARVARAETIEFDEPFDGALSNAVMHWIHDHDALLSSLHRALKPDARFVAELGGAGCVAKIRAAIGEALRPLGIDAAGFDPWYFPDDVEYRERLEAHGFAIEMIRLFPRPTPLPGELGAWLEIFAQPFLAPVPEADRAAVVADVQERLRPQLYDSAQGWTADYVRLRFAARRRALA